VLEKVKRREFLGCVKSGLLLGVGSPLLGAGFFSTNDHAKDFLWLERADRKDIITELEPQEDIILRGEEYKLLKKTFYRFKRIQKTVGYGHFNVVSFDEALKLAHNHSSIGEFTKEELDLIEKLFYESASKYGFYGEKVLDNLTGNIAKNETKKIPYTGHYLFRGRAEVMYKEIQKDMGNKVILTSGVRNIVKQIYLFLNKAIKEKGNLSLASRSLAPPGYSFHSIGDFDVGKVGFGYRNFTAEFAKTDEYKKLMDLGYIKIRYPQGNPFGVRFEPWHIKVV
jgi:hypothetical protein